MSTRYSLKWSWKKKFLIILLILLICSLLPLIPFWLTSPSGDNNQSNIKKLSHNQGSFFSFIVFGDNRAGLFFDDAATLKLIRCMNQESLTVPIDFVLNTGDITLAGRNSDFIAFKKIEKLIKWPLLVVIGNHENEKLFKQYVGQKEFAFSNRNSYFIILDNSRGELKNDQFAWLEKRLIEGQKYDHIFVAMHKPAFIPYLRSRYITACKKKWAGKFRKLCAKYNVDMVLCGHEHMFKHEKIDGVDYIVTGGGGVPITVPEKNGGYIHYVRVMVDHDYISYEVRRVSAPLWEYFTYYFWKKAVNRLIK